MTHTRTYLDFTPFFKSSFQVIPLAPQCASPDKSNSRHLPRAHKLPTIETNSVGVLPFSPSFIMWSLLAMVKFYSMGDVWSNS